MSSQIIILSVVSMFALFYVIYVGAKGLESVQRSFMLLPVLLGIGAITLLIMLSFFLVNQNAYLQKRVDGKCDQYERVEEPIYRRQ